MVSIQAEKLKYKGFAHKDLLRSGSVAGVDLTSARSPKFPVAVSKISIMALGYS